MPIDFSEPRSEKLINSMLILTVKLASLISSIDDGITTPVKPCVLPREYCEITVIDLPPNDDGIFATPNK